MKRLVCSVIVSLACSSATYAQMGRTSDWTTYGADAQRSGWEKSDSRFTKADLPSAFRFLWKLKPEGAQSNRTLMAPVIIGTLIGYRGFKELAFVAGSDDSLYVMDADLNRMYWEKHFEYSSDRPPPTSSTCAGGLSAMPALTPAGIRRPAGPRPGPGAAPRPAAPNPLFGVRLIYVISSDGKLHRLNISNGAETTAPAAVLPPGLKASALNIADNVLYTTTSGGCGDAPDTLWAIDISNPDPQVSSYVSKDGQLVGAGGPVIGNDGTIYLQATEALLALNKQLEVTGRFTVSLNATTPVAFTHNNRQLIVTAGKDGSLYLLDSSSLQTPLHRTEPLSSGSSAGRGISSGLSSWEDSEGTRWIFAPVSGPLAANLKLPAASSHTPNGSLVAFKVEDQDGKPVLSPGWVSPDMTAPAPPVIANGVVFALSNGDTRRQINATLYALDAATGKELWSTRNEVTAPGNFTGLTVANGRVYFATSDNTLWVFGVPIEI